jgi:hypothetical protein
MAFLVSNNNNSKGEQKIHQIVSFLLIWRGDRAEKNISG